MIQFFSSAMLHNIIFCKENLLVWLNVSKEMTSGENCFVSSKYTFPLTFSLYTKWFLKREKVLPKRIGEFVALKDAKNENIQSHPNRIHPPVMRNNRYALLLCQKLYPNRCS